MTTITQTEQLQQKWQSPSFEGLLRIERGLDSSMQVGKQSYLHSHCGNKRIGENWQCRLQKAEVSDKSWEVKYGAGTDIVTESWNIFKILRGGKKKQNRSNTEKNILTVLKHFKEICGLKHTSRCVKIHCSFRNDSVLTQLFLLVPVLGLFMALDN